MMDQWRDSVAPLASVVGALPIGMRRPHGLGVAWQGNRQHALNKMRAHLSASIGQARRSDRSNMP